MTNKIKILVLVSILVLYGTLFLFVSPEYPNSPDESQVIFFSKIYQETGKLTWSSEMNQYFNTSYFIPRGSVLVSENLYAPQISSTLILTYGFLDKVIGMKYVLFLTNIICIVFLFLFARTVVGKRWELVILIALIPSYLFYSLTINDLIPSLLYIAGALYLLGKFNKEDSSKILFLSLAFFFFGVFLRPHHIILGILFIPTFLKKRREIIKCWQGIAVSGVYFLALITINKLSYDKFLSTGRSLVGKAIGEEGTLNKLAQYGINLDSIIIAFKNHIIYYAPPLFLLCLLGILIAIKYKNNSQGVIYSFIAVFLISLVYYGSNSLFYNFYEIGIQGSLARYFLPLAIFGVIYSTGFITHQSKRIARIVVASILIISMMMFAFSYNSDLSDLKNNKEVSKTTNEWVRSLPEKSVFLVKQADKYIVPDREIMLIYDKTDLSNTPNIEKFYPLINKEIGINLIKKLQEENYEIYLTVENNFLINDKEVKLVKVNSQFYKLEYIGSK